MNSIRKISAAISVLAAFTLAACSAQKSDDTSALSESETVSETISETESETEAETESETQTETETESESETETEAETESETATAPPSEELPYELDPEISFPADSMDFYGLRDTMANKPMLAASPEGTDAEFYVMYSDESRAWTDQKRAYYYDGPEEYSTTEYVVIAHDGIADEIPYNWSARSGEAPAVFAGDYDGDGTPEIASVRYVAGGTYCNINELVIYDLENGHYVPYIFDHIACIEQDISHEIDNENKKIRFNFSDPNIGSDTDIFCDIDTSDLSSIGDISYFDIVEFNVSGDSITMMLTALLNPEMGGMPNECRINVSVGFSNGVYSLTDPVVFPAE